MKTILKEQYIIDILPDKIEVAENNKINLSAVIETINKTLKDKNHYMINSEIAGDKIYIELYNDINTYISKATGKETRKEIIPYWVSINIYDKWDNVLYHYISHRNNIREYKNNTIKR